MHLRARSLDPACPAPAAGTAPTVDAIVEKYVAAVGGADAIRKATSRVMKGKILTAATRPRST